MPQSIVEPLRRWDPERIGPYTIIGRLGAGAMGQVFLARSTAGRLVAVKTIRIELAEEPGFRARFAREVAAASRVSGVFTAAVIEADPEADLPWVATAYVPAPSLSTLVQAAGPLPVPAVRWLAAGCAEALQSIHGAGLLHRDVKPSNVLVAPDGPRVIDFGVARAAERVAAHRHPRGVGHARVHGARAGQGRRRGPRPPATSSRSARRSSTRRPGTRPTRARPSWTSSSGSRPSRPTSPGCPRNCTGLVAACLERVPRDRPSDAAILARLGSFALPAGPGHAYLPDDAMAVIGEYQRGPRCRPAGPRRQAAATTTRRTSGPSAARRPARVPRGRPTMTRRGSHTALPGFQSLRGHGARQRRGAGRARHRRFAPDQNAAPGPGRPRRGPAAVGGGGRCRCCCSAQAPRSASGCTGPAPRRPAGWDRCSRRRATCARPETTASRSCASASRAATAPRCSSSTAAVSCPWCTGHRHPGRRARHARTSDRRRGGNVQLRDRPGAPLLPRADPGWRRTARWSPRRARRSATASFRVYPQAACRRCPLRQARSQGDPRGRAGPGRARPNTYLNPWSTTGPPAVSTTRDR